jgi:hypothetical protein
MIYDATRPFFADRAVMWVVWPRMLWSKYSAPVRDRPIPAAIAGSRATVARTGPDVRS